MGAGGERGGEEMALGRMANAAIGEKAKPHVCCGECQATEPHTATAMRPWKAGMMLILAKMGMEGSGHARQKEQQGRG